MRLMHSADWQLGARFAQFGARAEALRQARLATLRTALAAARQEQVDAFLIAGDLFEDNQVEQATVAAVIDLFREFESVPVFVCPGNHDPFTGPDCVWNRRLFAEAPPNVTVFREPKAIELAGGYLVAAPLQQKVSTLDPSLKLVELARALPPAAIKIGMTHGAPAIPGKHQLNDFPISLQAATRAGLDYLAIGHWHSWQIYDEGRLVMPGTPEPDSFERTEPGCVAFVELPGRGAAPAVKARPVGTLVWKSFTFDLLDAAQARETLKQQLAALAERPDRTVLRLTLTGSAPLDVIAGAKAWLDEQLAPFPLSLQADESSLALSPLELQQLQAEHPLLAQVLNDLAHLQHLVAGGPAPVAGDDAGAIAFADAQRIAVEARIDLAALTPEHFRFAREVLFQKLGQARA